MKIKLLAGLSCLLILSISNIVLGADQLPIDVKKQAQERIDKGYHLGTVIGIIDKNGMRFFGFGHMSLTNQTTPDENAIFEIGSITKPFTATLLADLEITGEIKLNDAVQKHFPIFTDVAKDSGRIITLADLANHTAGLPRNPLNMDPNDDHRFRDYTLEDFRVFLSGYSLPSAAKGYSYSNLGYMVLERAIETKMGTDYETLVKDRILDVLKMQDSHFKVPPSKRNLLVAGFKNGHETDELDLGHFAGIGGLRSTAKDMLRFLGAQIGLYPSPLREAIKITQSEQFSGNDDKPGLGWHIMKREDPSKSIYFHKGGTNGFVSFVGFNPNDKIGVIVLVNGRSWFSDLGFRILDPSYPLKENLPTL